MSAKYEMVNGTQLSQCYSKTPKTATQGIYKDQPESLKKTPKTAQK